MYTPSLGIWQQRDVRTPSYFSSSKVDSFIQVHSLGGGGLMDDPENRQKAKEMEMQRLAALHLLGNHDRIQRLTPKPLQVSAHRTQGKPRLFLVKPVDQSVKGLLGFRD